MNKLYILIPVIGCLLFGAYFWNFNAEYKAKQAEKVQKALEIAKERQKQEVADRQHAYEAAIKAQAQRKAEREERERIEEEKKKHRVDLEEKRERAFAERRKNREQVDRLKKEVAGVEEEIAKLELQKKTHLDEQAFLKTYVKQAEANVKSYYDLLDKIEAAEKARAAAEAAAKAAQKS